VGVDGAAPDLNRRLTTVFTHLALALCVDQGVELTRIGDKCTNTF
jgi:hypothetical protein